MAKAPKKAKASSSLINALKFVSFAQKDKGNELQTHCLMSNGWLVASDGMLTVGCKTEEQLFACPQTNTLLSALLKCGDNLAITQRDNSHLAVKSGGFSVVVPCLAEPLSISAPDSPCGEIDNRITKGFDTIKHLLKDAKEDEISELVCSAIKLQTNTMLATNRFVVFEYWHGLSFPPNLIIPKPAIEAVVKSGKNLVSFGFSERSVTFHFEDESFIKTQRFEIHYPKTDEILNKETCPQPVPERFFEAVDTISEFGKGDIYFSTGALRSHKNPEEGATFEVDGLVEGPVFGVKRLKEIEPVTQTIDFLSYPNIAYFYGERLRGAVMGIRP